MMRQTKPTPQKEGRDPDTAIEVEDSPMTRTEEEKTARDAARSVTTEEQKTPARAHTKQDTAGKDTGEKKIRARKKIRPRSISCH